MLQTLQFFGDGERCKLDDTARKVALLCGNELHFVSTTGLLNTSGRLRAILLSAGLLLRTDIQELESLNSMLKIAMQRANTTTISLELLSSRVCIRKTIASLDWIVQQSQDCQTDSSQACQYNLLGVARTSCNYQ